MSKLEKIPIFFMSVESIVNTYIENENMNLDNIGVITDQKIILSQILYMEKTIIKHPYSLKVNKSTYIAKRKKVITYLIEEIIVKLFQKGRGSRTISTYLSGTINFINWSDRNNLCFLESIENAINVFWQYTYYLKDRIRLGTYSQGEAHSKHIKAHKMLHSLFNDTENRILAGNKIIPNKRNNKAEKSLDKDQKYHFNFCYKLFHQLTDFLLEGKEYPLKLDMLSGTIWCIPSKHHFITNNDQSPMAFNYRKGTINNIDEIFYSYKLKYRRDARNAIKNFIQQIDKHNSNLRSTQRLNLGYRALMAYYLYFLTITQMNDSTAATLLWSDDYKIEKDRQKFKNIKYRAGNKPVEFQIQSKFINDFKKFLKLREYLLDGKEFEYLFFVRDGINPKLSKRQKQGAFSAVINAVFIKTIDSKLPRLTSRQLRVNKTYQVIKKDGIVAASQLAQSSINTMITYYQGESQETTDKQLGEYFDTLNQNLFKKDENEKELTVGNCKSPNSPESDISLKGIDIDCSKSEGCLFCKHYGLHADERDIKKLFSLTYVINESRYIAKSEEHFLSVYGIVLSRVDNIMAQIIKEKRQTQKNIDLFQKDVYENENLHPYWEYKLKTLINMGVIK